MGKFTQAGGPLKFTSPLGPDVLLLVGLRGREAISELFHFELELVAQRQTDVPFEKVLGQACTAEIALAGGGSRFFNGVVAQFARTGRDDTFDRYRAALAPKFWLWQKKVQSRIFQQQSVPDILGAVFTGLKTSLQLTGNYAPRDFCVQYRESDFAFASRLMEEEGMYYYFVHAADGHQLVVTDNPFGLPDVPDPSSVIYDDSLGGTRSEQRVNAWELSQQVAAQQFTLRDHCFELPGQSLEAAEGLQESVQAGIVSHSLKASSETLEIYDYPGKYAQRFDGVDPGGGDRSSDVSKIFPDSKRTVGIRMQEEAAGSIIARGSGNCGQFVPGHNFTLMRHYHGDGKYLLTSVEHEAKLNSTYFSRSPGDGVQYANAFTCLPDGLPFCPRRVTPKPTISGVQTATVAGPSGEEIFVDKYGRIKVQFPWDRQGKGDANSSCWVRVGQIWAGQRWGAFFWPRIGQEVVVTFEEGDPDCPVVVGSVYNAGNMPPYPLPAQASSCGIKSCSFQGDPAENFNCVIFHDASGSENLQLHSETFEHITSEASKFHHTPGPMVDMKGHLAFPLSSLGSGSGGGWPTEEMPNAARQEPSAVDQDALHAALRAQEIALAAQRMQEQLSAGSGAGGGLLDFVTMAGVCGTKPIDEEMPGQFSMVSGDDVMTNFGGNYNFGFGPHHALSADIEELVLGKLLPSGPLGALLFGFGGSANLVLGSNAGLTYGENLTVQRGESTTVSQDAFWSAHPSNNSAMADAINVAVRALTVVMLLFNLIMNLVIRIKYQPNPNTSPGAQGDDEDKDVVEKLTFSLTFVYARLLGVLLQLERLYAAVLKAESNAFSSGRAIAQAVLFGVRVEETAANHAGNLLERAARRISDGLYCLDVKPLPVSTPQNTDIVQGGHYKITCKDIELTSQQAAAGATSIKIHALGGSLVLPAGTTANNGTVEINGTNQSSLTSGVAGVRAVRTTDDYGTVTVDGGLLGKVQLQAGAALNTGPVVVIDGTANTIKMYLGPEAAPTTLVQLGLLGITASFGIAPAANAIEITAAGVKISSGPTTTVDVTPQGVSISGLQLQTAAQIQSSADAVMAVQSATAELQEKVSILMALS